LGEEKKNSFSHEAILEISVWQKKQLTTAHEAVVSCTKQGLKKETLSEQYRKEIIEFSLSYLNF
jgi:hypothetical protein